MSFDIPKIFKEDVSFMFDGSLNDKATSLAVDEFDTSLRNTLNFQNFESVQCMLLTSGLEEARTVTHY